MKQKEIYMVDLNVAAYEVLEQKAHRGYRIGWVYFASQEKRRARVCDFK